MTQRRAIWYFSSLIARHCESLSINCTGHIDSARFSYYRKKVPEYLFRVNSENPTDLETVSNQDQVEP